LVKENECEELCEPELLGLVVYHELDEEEPPELLVAF
jgi:hypothetical protein